MARSEVTQKIAWMFALSLSLNVFGGSYFYMTRHAATTSGGEHGEGAHEGDDEGGHGDQQSGHGDSHTSAGHGDSAQHGDSGAEHNSEHGTAEHRTSEHGESEHAPAQHAAAEHGTAEHAAPKHAVAEHKTAEHGVSKRAAAAHGSSAHGEEHASADGNGKHEVAAGHAEKAAVAHTSGAGTHAAPHWSYEGKDGPNAWAKLDEGFQTCSEGAAQSPIDIKRAIVETGHEALAFHYKPSDLQLMNNGHTIQANYQAGNYITYKNERYDLAQFHFHNPSEHQFDGKARPLEVHLVHKNKKGELAVVGIAFEKQGTNATLGKLWKHLPTEPGHDVAVKHFDVAAFLPQSKTFYHYAGSLTTPPCSEGVKWFVMKDTIAASASQLTAFNNLFPINARPVQPLRGRHISVNAESLAH